MEVFDAGSFRLLLEVLLVLALLFALLLVLFFDAATVVVVKENRTMPTLNRRGKCQLLTDALFYVLLFRMGGGLLLRLSLFCCCQRPQIGAWRPLRLLAPL